jgi:alkylhydroperoxidase family enzyme
LKPVELEPADLSLCSFYVEHLGYVPESILCMFNAPEIARAFVPLNRAIMASQGRVEPSLKRLVGLYVALRLNCAYAAGHAIAGALRLGVREELLFAVPQFAQTEILDDRQRAALAIAASTLDVMLGSTALPGPPEDGVFRPAELVEIVAACCGYCFMSFWNTAVPPDESPAPEGSQAMTILHHLIAAGLPVSPHSSAREA